ncbi:MAG: histidinol-phosphatase HisJ family protein [Erysipelotrichia bacterium]|nr:histidinol-phosphatase HisJ family protein [Erysipelotrichia bacterium]NCC54723.1 histidinol-phosphatase HisJ family protein [Erysipelotrichia bacterium]
MIDGHMHLEYGDLSVDYVLAFVEKAREKGIKHIQILDHTHRFKEFEPMYAQLKAYPVQKQWLENPKMKFKDTLDDYMKLIKEVKAMDLDIDVKFGLEVCYVPEYKDFLKEVLSKYQFDFLVGAIHSIDAILYDMPFSKQLLWEKQDCNAIYKRYYELLLDLIESGLFTQLAHPDTIKLFNYYPTYDLTDTYHTIAKALNKHHMKAENNTGCYYRYQHKDMGLSDELLAIFKEHKVAMMSASDAHKPEDVGCCIKEIWDKTMK